MNVNNASGLVVVPLKSFTFSHKTATKFSLYYQLYHAKLETYRLLLDYPTFSLIYLSVNCDQFPYTCYQTHNFLCRTKGLVLASFDEKTLSVIPYMTGIQM